MKKSIDFNVHFNYLEGNNFIQRFASAYMFLEAKTNPEAIFYDPEIGGQCFGCGSGGEKHSCKKDKAAAKRCAFFFIFNTMCGNSAIRRRFDGTPTEMQKLIGDTVDEGRGCGSDFTTDFLFGYTGYQYHKCTDTARFKDEITASINAGKPVIAKVKSGNPRFHLITGYDGGDLIIPEFIFYDFSTNPPTEKSEKAPAYDDLEVLYLFGEKTTRRYTLKDALNNIRRVMEYNINSGLWDEYLVKLGGCDKFPSDDGLDKAEPDERKFRAQNLAETNMYMYNFCSFGGAFGSEKLPDHYLHKELFEPALAELWGNINDSHWAIVDAGHITGKLHREQIWLIDDPAKISGLSEEICREILKAKNADISMLGIINQAAEILEKK